MTTMTMVSCVYVGVCNLFVFVFAQLNNNYTSNENLIKGL